MVFLLTPRAWCRRICCMKSKLTPEQRRERDLEYLREWQKAHPNAHREWADAHKEYLAKYARERRAMKKATDPEWVKRQSEKRRAYVEANRAKLRESISKWRSEHPEFTQRKRGKRIARLYAAPVNDLTRAEWIAIKAKYKHHCAYCGKVSKRLTLDHIVPLAKGGSHTAVNVVPACHACNSAKSDSLDWKPMDAAQILEGQSKG